MTSTYVDGLAGYVEDQDFRGYDPYDALNSPIVRALTFGHKYGRMAWLQFMRRFPINLRPLLMIPKGHNPKGLGLFLLGYAKLYDSDNPAQYSKQIDRLLELLASTRSNCSGNGWGYNFDWQSKAFWVPKGTPTIVNTSFIGHGLLNYWRKSGDQRALDLAIPIKDFILNDLYRTQDGDSFCFGYTPLDQLVVHNSNLLGASVLIRLHAETGDEALKEAALASLSWSMKRQKENGSWAFGETSFQTWVDSFHTGFNLQSIRCFINAGFGDGVVSGYEKGVAYYADNFFTPEGAPKYYDNSLYPIDIHCPAQAIAFFSRERQRYEGLTKSILAWMTNNLWDEKRNFFYFRKGRLFTNKIPYMRWGQAWAFHALTSYVEAPSSEDSGVYF